MKDAVEKTGTSRGRCAQDRVSVSERSDPHCVSKESPEELLK